MGAGKSTYAVEAASELNAVLISEDAWLSAHYPGQIVSFEDYMHHASLIRPFIRDHVQNLLETGAAVVLDFPANTAKQRAWFRRLAEDAGAAHRLVYLKASDETCLRQIAMRRKLQPERAAFDTEAVFRQVTEFFEEPDDSEGFSIDVRKPAEVED